MAHLENDFFKNLLSGTGAGERGGTRRHVAAAEGHRGEEDEGAGEDPGTA